MVLTFSCDKAAQVSDETRRPPSLIETASTPSFIVDGSKQCETRPPCGSLRGPFGTVCFPVF